MLAIHLSRTLWRQQHAVIHHGLGNVSPRTGNLFRCSRIDIAAASRTYSTQLSSPSPKSYKQTDITPPQSRPSILSLILPSSFADAPQSASSFRKIISLAKPERKPLLIAVGLLLVSSSISMSIPVTIGKLIDFFSTTTSVRFFLKFSVCDTSTCHTVAASSFWSFDYSSIQYPFALVHRRCCGECR